VNAIPTYIHRRIFSWSGCEAGARRKAAQARTTMVLYDKRGNPFGKLRVYHAYRSQASVR
jgi:hypothetical protein